jgi:hypothetical protein
MLGGLRLRLLWPVFVLMVLGGCAGPEISSAIQVAQYGTTAFTRGSLETVVAQPFDKVVAATHIAVDELDLRVDVNSPQKDFLYLKAKDRQRSSVIIRIRRRTAAITSVSVKVGFFGDMPYSNAVMGKIGAVYKRLFGEPVTLEAPSPFMPPDSMNTSTPW